MEILMTYIKQILDLFQRLLEALGIEVNWEKLLGTSAQ